MFSSLLLTDHDSPVLKSFPRPPAISTKMTLKHGLFAITVMGIIGFLFYSNQPISSGSSRFLLETSEKGDTSSTIAKTSETFYYRYAHTSDAILPLSRENHMIEYQGKVIGEAVNPSSISHRAGSSGKLSKLLKNENGTMVIMVTHKRDVDAIVSGAINKENSWWDEDGVIWHKPQNSPFFFNSSEKNKRKRGGQKKKQIFFAYESAGDRKTLKRAV